MLNFASPYLKLLSKSLSDTAHIPKHRRRDTSLRSDRKRQIKINYSDAQKKRLLSWSVVLHKQRSYPHSWLRLPSPSKQTSQISQLPATSPLTNHLTNLDLAIRHSDRRDIQNQFLWLERMSQSSWLELIGLQIGLSMVGPHHLKHFTLHYPQKSKNLCTLPSVMTVIRRTCGKHGLFALVKFNLLESQKQRTDGKTPRSNHEDVQDSWITLLVRQSSLADYPREKYPDIQFTKTSCYQWILASMAKIDRQGSLECVRSFYLSPKR